MNNEDPDSNYTDKIKAPTYEPTQDEEPDLDQENLRTLHLKS